jgi:hypothetical protein
MAVAGREEHVKPADHRAVIALLDLLSRSVIERPEEAIKGQHADKEKSSANEGPQVRGLDRLDAG